MKENLTELRQLITELPEMYFYPMYYFEHAGHRVNESEELQKEIELEEGKDLDLWIALDDYDLRSMKTLIEKSNSFF